jgi:hypothetical protein
VAERLKEDELIFNPSDTIRYIAERMGVSVDALRIPERLLLTYQRSAFECAKSLIKGGLSSGFMVKFSPSALANLTVWR